MRLYSSDGNSFAKGEVCIPLGKFSALPFLEYLCEFMYFSFSPVQEYTYIKYINMDIYGHSVQLVRPKRAQNTQEKNSP